MQSHQLTSLHYIKKVALTLFWVAICSLKHDVESVDPISTITVDKSGHGNFTTVQEAIDSVPHNNSNWIRIHIKAGTYTEKVSVPSDKQFILIEGENRAKTIIESGDAGDVIESTTFTIAADNFAAWNITFVNTYNRPISRFEGLPVKWAPAVLIYGDKVSFHGCAFISLQDTLFDNQNRHYFDTCYIEGAIDFIWGGGKSYYKRCAINVTMGRLPMGYTGSITAQGRDSPRENSGFVFHTSSVVGAGPAFLGRAYRNHSTVVFYKTYMANVIAPSGWDAWLQHGHEERITFSEEGCFGAGSDMSKRVKWEKKLTGQELYKFIDVKSFINQDGWLEKQPAPNIS
ncbi:probable pectinesterase 29 [Ziziphus jujuba]|uniref:pectinesterase n=1 Tax=Ziziphus jujuba TaxID=326968 RepID=A0ABM3ZUH1_ZIZJJ|nr:probable pectinesterase 29 [Ziziphus jujuba]